MKKTAPTKAFGCTIDWGQDGKTEILDKSRSASAPPGRAQSTGWSYKLNSKIQMVKEMACGFRNRKHYKTAIHFHCGRGHATKNRPTYTSVLGDLATRQSGTDTNSYPA